MFEANDINELLSDEPYTEREAWQWLIDNISRKKGYKRFNGKIYRINISQIVTSNRTLGKLWHWNEARVRRFITRLKNYGVLDAETNSHGTVLTIVN